jgi:hypothetical protein
MERSSFLLAFPSFILRQPSVPGIIQRLPARIIADYLGISQETLSRLKAKK